MNIQDIIAKKRDKKELTNEEINYFVNEYTKGNITDYQAAALVMGMKKKQRSYNSNGKFGRYA